MQRYNVGGALESRDVQTLLPFETVDIRTITRGRRLFWVRSISRMPFCYIGTKRPSLRDLSIRTSFKTNAPFLSLFFTYKIFIYLSASP